MRRLRAPGARRPAWLWAARFGPARLAGRVAALADRRPRAALPDGPSVPLPAPVPAGRAPLRPVALFYAIDGGGLGHLSRCLAIARRLRGLTPVVATTCLRADVLDAYGISYRFVAPLEDRGDPAARAAWQTGLERTLGEMIAGHRPAVIVADGVAAEPGLLRAMDAAPEVGRVGIRRAYRLDGRQHLVAARDRAFHLLLVPHDPGTEPVVLPAGPGAAFTGPVTLTGRDETMPRAEARRALGLPAEGTCVLVQLGAGRIGAGRDAEQIVLAALAGRDAWAAVTRYSPGEAGAAGRVVGVSRFPLAECLAAFDLAVAAAGYNTFTELMHHGVPSILVPNAATISDDQVARARWAERAGAALVVTEGDAGGLRAALARALDDPALRERLGAAAAAMVPRNGAARAAALVEGFASAVLTRT